VCVCVGKDKIMFGNCYSGYVCVDGGRRAKETAKATHTHNTEWFIKPTTMSRIYEVYRYMCIFMWDRRWHRMSRRDLSADSDTHTHGRRGCPFLRPSRRWQISGRPRKAVGQNLWPLTYITHIYIYTHIISYMYLCECVYIYIYIYYIWPRDTRERYVFIIILCNKVLVHDCSVSIFSPLYYSFYDSSHVNRPRTMCIYNIYT